MNLSQAESGERAGSSTGGASKGSQALANIFRAARWRKNLPLLLLFANGALLAPSWPDLATLLVGSVTILTGAAFMTHLNILTDRDLDRETKPELYRWLNTSPGMRNTVMGLEIGVTAAGIGWLWGSGHWVSGAALAAFFWLTIQYSYNTLDHNAPAATRWKCSVWGHAAVVVGGYAALWMAGLGLAADANLHLIAWMRIILLISVSEYSLFLGESAIDAHEEKQAGLSTASAILGRKKTCQLALGISALCLVGYGTLLAFPGPTDGVVLLAFLPAFLLHFAALCLLAKRHQGPLDHAIRRFLPDLTFLGARGSNLIALLCLNHILNI